MSVALSLESRNLASKPRRDSPPQLPDPRSVLNRPAQADHKLLMSSDLTAQESEPMILEAPEDRAVMIAYAFWHLPVFPPFRSRFGWFARRWLAVKCGQQQLSTTFQRLTHVNRKIKRKIATSPIFFDLLETGAWGEGRI